MSTIVITLETQANSSDHLIIQRPAAGLSLQGRIRVPGDKSISHRALMLGAIAEGETQIQGLLLGEDPRSTAACFRALGAEISDLNTELVKVKGIGLGNFQEPINVLDAGNSGTTMRLMLGLLASHPGRFFTVTGDSSLRSRPMSRVVKPLQQMGAQIWGRKGNTLAPLAIQGQALKPIHYHSPMASAQVKSCILLAGLNTQGQTTVTEPALSRDHSERMLRAYGAELSIDPDRNSVTITGGAKLYGQTVIVPGDIIPRLIDEIPILAVAAAFAEGTTIIRDAEELRVKESDRITVMAQQLNKMGAKITELPDGMEITGGTPLVGAEVDSHTDHRIAMSLAIAALNATGTTTIHRAEAAAISYPNFTITLREICQ